MFKVIAITTATAALAAGISIAAAPSSQAIAPGRIIPISTASAPTAPGDIVTPPMPQDSTGTPGTVNFQLTNSTSQPVTFNVNVTSDAQNETSLLNFQSYVYNANPQVEPGQTVVIPVVAGGLGRTDGSDPIVTVGLQGYAQFEMWVHVNTWSNSDFQNIEYQGKQTGGGDTGGLSQVNLGNGSVISNGNAGINNDWTYVNGTTAGFVAS